MKRPFPIFPSPELLRSEFPDNCTWLPKDLTDSQYSDFAECAQFLIYKSRSSSQTYSAYRNDIERFLLWTWCIKERSLPYFGQNPYDIEEFFDFINNPPRNWAASGQRKHLLDGNFPNPDWRPFKVTDAQESGNRIKSRSKTIERKLTQSTINRVFSSLSSLFGYLHDQDYISKNPIPIAKSHSQYNVKRPRPEPTNRHFSKEQWDFIKETLTELADQDQAFERVLFSVLLMKTCYLRISEISTYSKRGVTMGQFKAPNKYRDCWVFEVYGKGKEIREVTVPDDFLPHLERYRISRNLSPLPYEGEQTPLIHKVRGLGAMSVRQASRLIDQALALCAQKMRDLHGDKAASKLNTATTHFLRHTGVTFDLETRPIKHLQIEVGHKSSRTTDEIYAGVDRNALIKSGKKRSV